MLLLEHAAAAGQPPPSGAAGSQSWASPFPHAGLHADVTLPKPLCAMQQTVPDEQLACPLHLSAAMTKAPASRGHAPFVTQV
jgi:hypothetical protein